MEKTISKMFNFFSDIDNYRFLYRIKMISNMIKSNKKLSFYFKILLI